jgi:ketosteroid isomerase-like protein
MDPGLPPARAQGKEIHMISYYRFAVGAATFALALLATSCTQPADTRASNEAAIRDADIAWSKAAAAKEVDSVLSYYADDASSFVDKGPIATGKQAIGDAWRDLFHMGYAISWQPTKVEVAQSGDLGYSQGTYEQNTSDSKGNPATNKGKYVVVWKKALTGSWKAVAEIANSD